MSQLFYFRQSSGMLEEYFSRFTVYLMLSCFVKMFAVEMHLYKLVLDIIHQDLAQNYGALKII